MGPWAWRAGSVCVFEPDGEVAVGVDLDLQAGPGLGVEFCRGPVFGADAHLGGLGDSAVVEGDTYRGLDGMREGVIDHGHGRGIEVWDHLEPSVPIAAVGAAQGDEVTVEDGAVFFIELNPAGDHGAGSVRIIEAWATEAGLDTGTEEVGEAAFVVVEVFCQGFDGGGCAAAVVFGQRDEHPSHGGGFEAGAIEDILAFDDFLLGSGEGPVGFAVAHAGFTGAMGEVPVGDIEVDALASAPLVEGGDSLPLFPA